jgi:20S proteasome alpha/beta subunit
MTMQIGMIASDGVIIASDRRWVDQTGVRHTFAASKVVLDSARGIAVGRSGSYLVSLAVADRIIAELVQSDSDIPRISIQNIANQVWNKTSRHPSESIHCLVALNAKDSHSLFSLQPGPDGLVCENVFDKMCTGDLGNAALFFHEGYYTQRPISELKFLAAHIVLSAARLNPIGVDGLEMVLCDANGIHSVSPGEIQEMKSRSTTLDAHIRASLCASDS